MVPPFIPSSMLRIMGDIVHSFRLLGNASPIDGLSSQGIVPGKREEEDAELSEAQPFGDRAKGRIELRNVNFRYPTRPNVEVLCILIDTPPPPLI
jgi:hypothetical protein